MVGQRHDLLGDRVADRFGAMPGESRSVLDAGLEAVAFHGRKAQQHREPGGAFDERADRRTVHAEDEVAFPVARNRSIVGFGGSFADHDLGRDELLAAPACARSWHAQRPAGSQASDELAFERPSSLDVERLVDGLVGDPHGLIIGEIDLKSIRDLLRAPCLRPAPVGAATVTAADEAHLRARRRLTVGSSDLSSQAILHVIPQPIVRHELRDLRTTRAPLGMPLRGRRPIRHLVAARRRVATQLSRDRPRVTPETTADLTHTDILRMQQCDLLALGERQITARHRSQRERRHAASLSEPPGPNRGCHTCFSGRVLARQAARDCLPEANTILTPRS
jgi:hypothetical protein